MVQLYTGYVLQMLRCAMSLACNDPGMTKTDEFDGLDRFVQ